MLKLKLAFQLFYFLRDKNSMLNLLKINLLVALLAVVNPGLCGPMNDQPYHPPTGTKKYESYSTNILTKLGWGFANLVFGVAEIPKNIINTTNETNLALGITGGVAKGVLHTAGRMLAGTVDILTFPIPTEPLTNPTFAWENYKTETSYNPLFKMKN